ncbi:MAG: hypothetical protein OES24_19630 [Acidimicrobiia bacterium]|nr:hypothetical protein [Acidimicrobiia bacterium]
MSTTDRHRLDDYRITVDIWRQYVDTRFDLLRLVPLATGVGVAFVADQPSAESALVAVGALASLFGILMYDLRNSVLHDATVHRAKELERLLNLERVSGLPEDVTFGGPFTDRPPRKVKLMGVLGWHDRALNIVYSTSAAAWTAVLVVSLLAEWQWPATVGSRWILAAWLALLASAGWFYAIAKWERDADADKAHMGLRRPAEASDESSDDQDPETRQAQ